MYTCNWVLTKQITWLFFGGMCTKPSNENIVVVVGGDFEKKPSHVFISTTLMGICVSVQVPKKFFFFKHSNIIGEQGGDAGFSNSMVEIFKRAEG